MLDEIMPELNFDDPEVMRQAQEELKQQKAKEYKDYVASLSQKPAGYSQIDNLLTPERDLSDDVVNAVAKSQQVNPNSAAIQDQVALRRILSAGSGGSKIPIFMPGGVQLNTYDPAERKRMDDWAKEPYEQALKQNELNNDNLRRLTQAQNILDLQGARKSQMLKRAEDAQRMADELRMKKDAINPNSFESKSAVEIFQKELGNKSENYMQSGHNALKRIVPQLDAMISAASGRSKAEIEKMAKSAQSVIDAAEKEAGLDVTREIGKSKNYIALAGLQNNANKDDQKRQDDLRKVSIPGYNFFDIDNNMPTPDAAKAMRAATAAAAKMHSNLNKIKNLVSQEGLSVQARYGVGRELNQLYNEVILQAKEIDRLGALTGADIKLESSVIPDPTNALNAVQGRKSYLNLINNYENVVTDSINQIAPTMGYSPTPNLIFSIKSGNMSNLERSPEPIKNPKSGETTPRPKSGYSEEQEKGIFNMMSSSGMSREEAINFLKKNNKL